MKLWQILLLGFGACACDDPLKPVELVDGPRVLGARVEVSGDPERAAPAPGESARVRFLLASPELSQPLGFAFEACPATERRGSRAACAGERFAEVENDEGSDAEPSLLMDVPSNIDAAGRVAIFGVICPNGSPRLEDSSCEGSGAGTPVQLEMELARDDDANRNPELQADGIRFDEREWTKTPAQSGDCVGLGFPEVEGGSRHTLEVVLDESDRDSLPQPSRLDPARESLQLSHFVTGGELTRAFQAIAWDSGELDRRVEWTAPTTPGLVRFWFVLRDLRGGGDFAARAVCVR